MKRRGFTWVEALVIMAIIVVLALILFPVFARSRCSDCRPPSCLSHLKQIGLGIMQYSQDYDERLPLINVEAVSSSVAPYSAPYGWADAAQPYLKTTKVFQCPSEKSSTAEGTDAVQSGFTDYWFNTNLSGVKWEKSDDLAFTVLLGDGNDGADLTDARYNRNSLPLSWLQNSGSPALRYFDGAYYAFADGHAKFYKPEHIKNTRAKAGDISFALK